MDEPRTRAEFDELRFVQTQPVLDEFWARFGGMPDMAGKRVIDFGCGRGGMVDRAMEAGARSALGIDLNPDYITFAQQKVARRWSGARFVCADIRHTPVEMADVVVSCNTMEHVIPLRETLRSAIAACRPGGELFIGFSPLWHSPYGHHGLIAPRRPWAHLPRRNRAFLDRLHDEAGNTPDTIAQMGFNGATPADFRAALSGLSVEVISARRNVAGSPLKAALMRAMLLPAIIPALEKFVTVGLYWHLRRREA